MLHSWIDEDKQRPFNPAIPGLLRIKAHRLGATGFQLAISFHHAILDGWSVASLFTELFRTYCLLLEGRSIDGAKPLSSYRDFIELEQGALKSADARKYWEDQLYGAVSEQSFWKGQQKRIEARRVEAILQDELMQGLKLLCVDARASMKYVALAAHISVIGLISGQKDIVTGLVSNGRPETESGEEVLGLFLNTLPLRIQLHGQRWIELVRDVATAEAALLPFRRFPLAEIQRIGGSKPIFETLFNFVHFHVFRELDTIKGIRVTNAGGFEQTNFPFVTTFSLDPLGEKLRLRIDYEGTFIKNEEVDAILNYYLAALHFLANESNRICLLYTSRCV